MILQPIVNIAEICARKGIQDVILSPGSRCAPLTIAFVRHPLIQVKTVSDERAAAFIALGISLQKKIPVGLVCTSGSAAYNYSPAVAEAFYQQVPLLIFTADRPPEWIDQLDGQTIRQRAIFGSHVKASLELPVAYEHADATWHIERLISEAINISSAYPYGPVHINIPLREPFYPTANEEIHFDKEVKVIDSVAPQYTIADNQLNQLKNEWCSFDKILLVAGQAQKDEELTAALGNCMHQQQTPCVADVISNVYELSNGVRFHDIFLGRNIDDPEALKPDLLVTFGNSVISKPLKQFLRKFRPKAHWHIQPAGEAADTFQSLTKVIHCQPAYFFNHLVEAKKQTATSYLDAWKKWDDTAEKWIMNWLPTAPFGEMKAIQQVLDQLPHGVNLHLANSMAVRYVNILALKATQVDVEVFANRGTSGIDGSNSTAVGSSFCSTRLNILITGDMAFFYDRNAFWHNYPMPNLRIVLLNNKGGGIFNLIDGPSDLPEAPAYFVTKQALNAFNTCKDHGLTYLYCNREVDLAQLLQEFFIDDGKSKVLEIETDQQINKEIFKMYKSKNIAI